ncbi:hypothetical protein PJ267_07020 [Arthrobacter sp. OVS8]|nr:hypothetical protein PJ267_07020 [Arthrobacter sp. OVS8]
MPTMTKWSVVKDDTREKRRRELIPRVALLACLALVVVSLGMALRPGARRSLPNRRFPNRRGPPRWLTPCGCGLPVNSSAAPPRATKKPLWQGL